MNSVNPSDGDAISEFYSSYFAKSEGGVHGRTLAPVGAHIPPSLDCHVLDAGCGDGSVAHLLANSGYKHVTACDILEQDLGQSVRYLRADLAELPFASGSFDFVYCLSSVYYVRPPVVAMAELSRVLRREGVLVLTVPTRYSLPTMRRLWMRDVMKSPSMRHLSGVPFPGIAQYERWLREVGLDLVEWDGWGRVLPLRRNVYWHRWGNLRTLNEARPTPRRGTVMGRWLRSRFAYHATLVAMKP